MIMADHPRSISGIGEDGVGIPDDLRCKRSDGKQWRCTAMSMPDKTVCEKHYIQAKKRAANSAMRASLKKAKRNSLGESDIYLESKNDDMGSPLVNTKIADYPSPLSGKKYKEKTSRNHINYSPETPMMSVSVHGSLKSNDDLQRDVAEYEESLRSYRTPTSPPLESSKNRTQKIFDSGAMTDTSDGSSDSAEDTGGQTCHQCRRNYQDRVTWCQRCDRRGYCSSCISTWYSDIPLEEIQRFCPACRGTCSCRVCLRAGNLIKARIREIPAQDKLQYLHCLLSSVLPVVRLIHSEQCYELGLEKRLRGNGIDLARTKLNADEQMCCDLCRTPIIDYHRHCINCSYDLCLSCCQDLREAPVLGVKREVGDQIVGKYDDNESILDVVTRPKLRFKLLDRFPHWKANSNGRIPCPPREYGGCGSSSLILKRIFKMNWVAKLVKNIEEMVSGCKVHDAGSPEKTGFGFRLCKYACREDSDDNLLYCPSSQDMKTEGIEEFRMHWSKGEPIIVKGVCDSSSISMWDPMVIWRGIKETTEEKMKDDNRTVKAIDCLDWSEISIDLGQFIKGYSEGRIHENGWPEMLKLKDWPSPSSSEEFLWYQRPEFINKLPLLEYIHSKWGLLNVAAKLPHFSLQNDAGPKLYISYGTREELGRGDCVDNLHFNMRDMVYLLVHTCEVKLKGWQRTKIEMIQKTFEKSDAKNLQEDAEINECKPNIDLSMAESTQGDEIFAPVDLETITREDQNRAIGDASRKTCPGAHWDVFRRQDVPKLIEYLRLHWKEFGKPDKFVNDSVPHPLHDAVVYLNGDHKVKLKQEFGVEPWSFEQHLGQAVFLPAGCPFQVRNLQSTVQLGLDFLSPEGLGDALRLSGEIRGLPNDHDAKFQMLEVGKISLYAASSAIREVQKLVLDPKLGTELGFEDPNLTAMVSENLEKMIKWRQITCA